MRGQGSVTSLPSFVVYCHGMLQNTFLDILHLLIDSLGVDM